MALVIFCVALVEAMRTRMSLSEAILGLTHSTSVASPSPACGGGSERGPARQREQPQPTGFAGRPPAQAGAGKKSSKRLGGTLGRSRELRRGVGVEAARAASRIETTH